MSVVSVRLSEEISVPLRTACRGVTAPQPGSKRRALWAISLLRSLAGVAVVAALITILPAPSARAEDLVTYEVTSDDIGMLNLEYVDQTGRKVLHDVVLPWRLDVMLDDARGPVGQGAQIRVDWRWRPSLEWWKFTRWVTVRIYSDGELLCQSTLYVSNATCYGNTPHIA